MAYPTGIAHRVQGPSSNLRPIAETSTTQWHPVGTKAVAIDYTYGPATFLYLLGVASTLPGDLVCYDTLTGATARAVHGGASSTGPCAVAMSANVAGQYGWYMVEGCGPVASATVADDAPLYLTSTAGTVDDAAVSGDLISGIASRAASSAGFVTCQLDYPSLESTADATALTLRKITLSAAIEAADAIVVTGQVTDALGTNIAAATQVLVRTLAVTADKGDISVTAGTSKKVVNPATGENVAWIETTGTGGFAVSVANTAVEDTMVQATADLAAAATLKLTFT